MPDRTPKPRKQLLLALGKLAAALTVLATAGAGYLDARTAATSAQRAVATETAAADASWTETASATAALRLRIDGLESRLVEVNARLADLAATPRAHGSPGRAARRVALPLPEGPPEPPPMAAKRPRPAQQAVQDAYRQIQQQGISLD